MEVIRGIPVSPGIVIGRVFRLGQAEQQVPHRKISEEEIPAELARAEKAFDEAISELSELRDRTQVKLGAEPAKIFEFHILLNVIPVPAQVLTQCGQEKIVNINNQNGAIDGIYKNAGPLKKLCTIPLIQGSF